MRRYENDCVGCTDVGLRCLHTSCPNYRVLHFYCDECDGEKKLYRYDDKELCIECIKDKLEVVDGTEYLDN